MGSPGRRLVRELLPGLRERLYADAVVANGENAAGGAGITLKTANEVFSAGVDLITSGDHVWDQKEIMKDIDSEPRLLRPYNYPDGAPGNGFGFVRVANRPSLGVLNLQGVTFMPGLENPFSRATEAMMKIRQTTNLILVDFHAEATSEKIALGRYLDGGVSAVIGTHTHVQTADETIFPGGTAFLCDAGFTGAHESVLGREIEPIIKRFVTVLPQKFDVAKKGLRLQGVLIDIDEDTGRALAVSRVSEVLEV